MLMPLYTIDVINAEHWSLASLEPVDLGIKANAISLKIIDQYHQVIKCVYIIFTKLSLSHLYQMHFHHHFSTKGNVVRIQFNNTISKCKRTFAQSITRT